MALVKRGVFVTHGGGYTMNSNAKSDDLPEEVRALLSTEEGRAKLRAALDKIEEPEEEVAANASRRSDAPLRPGAVLTAKPDRVMHTNKADCQCERCVSRSATSRSRSDRTSPTDDAPLVPRGVLR